MKRLTFRFGMIAMLVTLASPVIFPQFAPPNTAAAAGSAYSIPLAQLIQPEALNRLLQAGGTEKPLVLQVGSHLLFAEAHIPGAEYAGQGALPAGIEQLQNRVSALSRKKLIVLYCGCYPWNRCPNVGPAFARLQEMGFTNVKVLYLAENFGTNWLEKGYPVEKGR
ncbi:MAG: rhodanese-like domain-containing protein [Terracidiphilus sp.]